MRKTGIAVNWKDVLIFYSFHSLSQLSSKCCKEIILKKPFFESMVLSVGEEIKRNSSCKLSKLIKSLYSSLNLFDTYLCLIYLPSRISCLQPFVVICPWLTVGKYFLNIVQFLIRFIVYWRIKSITMTSLKVKYFH